MATMREKFSSSASPLLGLCNSYPAPGIIECMCKGYDVLWIDGQHGQFDYLSCLAAIRTAAATGILSMVRVLDHNPAMIGAYADLSPDALLVPMVNTKADAEKIVQSLNFPPRGNRSYGGRRAYDLHGANFPKTATPFLLAQIETGEAYENLDGILSTPGVDSLFFGAEDFKLSLGHPVETPALSIKEVAEAMTRTAQACKAAGQFSACLAYSEPAFRTVHAMGYNLIIAGSDSTFLRTGAAATLQNCRKLLAT